MEALDLLASPPLLAFLLSVVKQAGSVQLARIADSLCKQLHHLIHTKSTLWWSPPGKRQSVEIGMKVLMFALFGSVTFTDLVIGDEGNTVVDSHSANEEVILQVPSVVVGQVYHQVNMTLTYQSVKDGKSISNIV